MASEAKQVKQVEKASIPVATLPVESEPTKSVIMTNQDAYLHERMKSQPGNLDDILKAEIKNPQDSRNRLDLPPFFKKLSYDHADGKAAWIFKWLYNKKQAVDHATTVKGWFLVNRRYFPDAPSHLWSANGGIEEGDAILAFMRAEQALLLRAAPGKKSLELVKAQLNKPKEGGPFYEAKLDADVDGTDFAPVGALQEGRDFKVN